MYFLYFARTPEYQWQAQLLWLETGVIVARS